MKKLFYKSSPQKIAYMKMYRKKHRARLILEMREYYQKNKDKFLKKKHEDFVRIYRTDAQYREQKRAYGRNRHKKFKQLLLDYFGGKCVRCGFSDVRALQVDHVFGDGYKLRKFEPKTQNPTTRLKYIKQYPERYQLLCANCNWIKRVENEEAGSGDRADYSKPERIPDHYSPTLIRKN